MEQNKGTNKKKLVVALALLALIVVASVITTVVLVLAAPQQNVGSNIDVTYSVNDVSATVSGRYGLYNADASKTVFDGQMTDSITIQPTDTTASGVEPKSQIALSSTQSYVVFEYVIKNNADNQFTVKLSYTDDVDLPDADQTAKEDKNVLVGYRATTSAISEDYDYTTVYNKQVDANNWAENWAELGETQVDCGTCDATATATDTVYVYVIVLIENLSASATFSGQLNFALAAID